MSISPTSEMAVLLNSRAIGAYVSMGTSLARLSREVLRGKYWSTSSGPTGSRQQWFGRRSRSWRPQPLGVSHRKTLVSDRGLDQPPALLARGDLIAFADHPLQADDTGSLAIVDMAGNKKLLSSQFFTIQASLGPLMARRFGSLPASPARTALSMPRPWTASSAS